MHQKAFSGGAPPGSAGELKRSPDPLAAIRGVLFLRGGEGSGRRKGKDGREGKRGEKGGGMIGLY